MNDKLELTLDTPNFAAYAESRRVFVPKENGRKGKDGKPEMIPIKVRGIDLTCKRSGDKFRFPMTTRDGAPSFGDTRKTSEKQPRRYTLRELRVELGRMVGEDNADRLINIATY